MLMSLLLQHYPSCLDCIATAVEVYSSGSNEVNLTITLACKLDNYTSMLLLYAYCTDPRTAKVR
jgi:hypothetical protein